MWAVITPAQSRPICFLPVSSVVPMGSAPSRTLGSSLVLLLLLCLWLTLPATARAQANPTVPAGGSATFARTGTAGPSVFPWDIVLAGSPVATASSPNGWSVSYNSGTQQFTVGVNADLKMLIIPFEKCSLFRLWFRP